MEAYKFETTILKDGIIQIPEFIKHKNKQIELFVVFKQEEKKEQKKVSASEFLEKWTGFAKDINADEEKYNYLMEKYK